MHKGMAVLIAAAVFGVTAPSAAAQDMWAVDDPCGDSGRIVSASGGHDVGVIAGDFFRSHDLRRAEVHADPAGGVLAKLGLCADVGGSRRSGGARGISALAGGCSFLLEAHDAPTGGDPTASAPLEPRLSGECGSEDVRVVLPASALVVTGRNLQIRLSGDEPGLPEVVRRALQPGVVWQELRAHARPTAVEELGVFHGDVEVVLSPGGNTDRAGGSGAVVLRG